MNYLPNIIKCFALYLQEYLIEIFRRYKKISEEIIPIVDGDNPAAYKVNPDYKQQPSNPRKCVQCHETHDTIVENTMTGERIEELEKCKICLMAGTKWINVNDGLPENGKQVLTLLEGYFGSPDNLLCQKRSYRVFQSTFHRYKGWETPFSPNGCWVKYWMDKPNDPVLES